MSQYQMTIEMGDKLLDEHRQDGTIDHHTIMFRLGKAIANSHVTDGNFIVTITQRGTDHIIKKLFVMMDETVEEWDMRLYQTYEYQKDGGN